MQIIDAHLHVGRFKNDIYSDKKRSDNYLKNLDFGIVSSVVGVVDNQNNANKKTLKLVRYKNNSFKGLIWINPYDPPMGEKRRKIC